MDDDSLPYLCILLAVVLVPPVTLLFSVLVCIGAYMKIKDQSKSLSAEPNPLMVHAFLWGALGTMTSLCMMWIHIMLPQLPW